MSLNDTIRASVPSLATMTERVPALGLLAALLAVALLAVPGRVAAQQTKILPNDPGGGDRFGASAAVAVSDDGAYAIVGAPRDDLGSTDQGSAYIFARDGSGNWAQQAKITGSNLSSDFPNFGSSVAIDQDGNYVAVGAQVDDPNGQANAGAAYVFTRSGTTWSQQAKLVASDPQPDDFFGFSIGINGAGDRVIVGARYEDAGGNPDQGSAYIFSRSSTSWAQEAKITGGDLGSSSFPNFGFSVSMNGPGDRAVVGAPLDDPTDPTADNGNGTQDGSAYVFERMSSGDWSEETKLLSAGYEPGDNFGHAVSINNAGDRLIVGAPFEDPNGNPDQGSAYTFARTGGWEQTAKITGDDLDGASSSFPNFGSSVAMSGPGERALVGAPFDDPTDPDANNGNGSQDGSAYVFTRMSIGDWAQETKVLANDYAPGDNFGTSVALSVDAGVVGAPFDDGNAGADQGGAYVLGPSSIPVELLSESFSVRQSEGTALVSWTTLSESNNSGFELQRRASSASSTEAATWTKAAFVDSKAQGGTSSEALSYTARIEELPPGTHTFRLVQVDLDGSRTVAAEGRTLEIGLDAAFQLTPVRPSPVREQGRLTISVQKQQAVTVTLHDVLGRKVRVLHDGPLVSNSAKILTLDASSLPSGMYFVRLRGETFTGVRKVVVAR